MIFLLTEINLIEQFLPGDLVEAEVAEGHRFARMVEQTHDQTDVVVGLNVDPISAGLAHGVGAKIVDAEKVASFGHNLIELFFGDVTVRMFD